MYVEDILDFCYTHGGAVQIDENFNDVINWFLDNKRTLVVDVKGKIAGVCAYMVLDNLNKLLRDEWPDDNPQGKYLYVRYLTVHKKARTGGIMKYMGDVLTRYFPNLEYVVYHRPDDEQPKIVKIDKFLRRRDG